MNASKFVEVLKACESASGAGSKKVIQAALGTLDEAGRFLMNQAMNPFIVFGIKKFELPDQGYADVDPDIGNLTKVLYLLETRQLTGDAARQTWAETLLTFTEDTAHYIERIVDKDPRAGFSADTFNKIWPNDPIPTFEVMLADKCTSPEEFEAKVTIPCWAGIKADGQRNVIIVRKIGDELTIEHFARSGKPSNHLAGLLDDDLKEVYNYLGYDFVMDGEAIARNFTETINAKKGGEEGKEAKSNIKFRLFTFMSYEEWLAKKANLTFEQGLVENARLLSNLQIVRGAENVKIVPEGGRMVTSYQDMMNYCNEVIDKYGEEGLILKDLKSSYVWDRDLAWTKVKRFFDADLTIIGLYPGRPKSRLENSMGGVVAAGYLEDGTLVVTRVGSGFSDAQRTTMWNDPTAFIGTTFVCKYQDVTKARDKTVSSLRFGTYEHHRDDKDVRITPEDMESIQELVNKLLKAK